MSAKMTNRVLTAKYSSFTPFPIAAEISGFQRYDVGRYTEEPLQFVFYYYSLINKGLDGMLKRLTGATGYIGNSV